MLVIICTKYGKNPSGTVDPTERTRFSRPRPNDLEGIGQGQRSLYATHPLLLVIICAKYGKNLSRTVDFFFHGQGRKISKICQKFKFPDSEKNLTRDTPSNDSDHLCQYKKNPSRTVDATEQTRFSKSWSNDLEEKGQGQMSSHVTHLLMLVIICTKYGKNPSGTVDATEQKQFSWPRPNDLEDISQGQRSLYATHPLLLVIICAKYGKNPLRTVEFFFSRSRPKNVKNLPKIQISRFWKKSNTRHTL